MNYETFKLHFVGLSAKIAQLRQAKIMLELDSDKILDSEKYLEKLKTYNSELDRYQKCQDALISIIDNKIKEYKNEYV